MTQSKRFCTQRCSQHGQICAAARHECTVCERCRKHSTVAVDLQESLLVGNQSNPSVIVHRVSDPDNSAEGRSRSRTKSTCCCATEFTLHFKQVSLLDWLASTSFFRIDYRQVRHLLRVDGLRLFLLTGDFAVCLHLIGY